MAAVLVLSQFMSSSGDAIGQLGYLGTAPGGTDHTSGLQSAINTVAAFNSNSGGMLIWDGAWGISGLNVPSNVWIFCPGPQYGAILRNAAAQPMFVNSGSVNGLGDASANQRNTWGTPVAANVRYRSVGPFANQNIRVSGGTWNGNNPNNTGNVNTGMSNPGGVLAAFQFYGVNNLIIEGVTCLACCGYAITSCNLQNGIFRDIVIDQAPSTNSLTDGIHINGPATQVRINNIQVHAHDDNIAILPDDGAGVAITTWYPIAGDISNCRIQDITCVTGNDNTTGLGAIRLLSQGSLLDDIWIDNLTGTIQNACIRAGTNGNPGTSPTYNPGNGNVGNIYFNNISIVPTNCECWNFDWSTFGETRIMRRHLVNPPSGIADVVCVNTGGGKNIQALSYDYDFWLSNGQTDHAIPKIECQTGISNVFINANEQRDSGFTANANAGVLHLNSNGGINGVAKFSGRADKCGYLFAFDTGSTVRTVVMDGVHSNANGGSPLLLGTTTVNSFIHTDLANVGAAHSGGTVTNDSTSSFASGNHYAD
jgi:hypothetical protein